MTSSSAPFFQNVFYSVVQHIKRKTTNVHSRIKNWHNSGCTVRQTGPNIWLFVHGQGGNKTKAAAFAALAAPTGWQVLGIDLPEHGDRTVETDFTPWQVVPELQTVLAYLQQHWQGVRLRANSIGAYFPCWLCRGND